MSKKTYGDVVAYYVKNYDGDTITVSIPSFPAVIGDNIPIRLRNRNCHELRKSKNYELAIEAKKYVEEICTGKKLLLKDLERGKYFRLVAEVIVLNDDNHYNGINVGDMLLENGLAEYKEY